MSLLDWFRGRAAPTPPCRPIAERGPATDALDGQPDQLDPVDLDGDGLPDAIEGVALGLEYADVAGEISVRRVIASRITRSSGDYLYLDGWRKADVVARLAACESAGHSEDDGIIIFDTNNRASIGRLQFQKATVIHYMKRLYGQDITAKEAVLIALDTEKAKALATDIIFTTDNDATDWLNCSNKLGLGADIKAIKKLAK